MRVRSQIRRVLGLRSLEDYTMESRRRMWPPALPLETRHLRNCRVLAGRDEILALLPTQSQCAEIGIWQCAFSEKILQTTAPSKLHLVDISPASCNVAQRRFANEIAAGRVFVHCGDSSPILFSFPQGYFDWIYIDGDHSYAGAKKDLEASRTRVRSGGTIVLNDYIFFSPSDFRKYGVVEAVNEFCVNHDWEIVYFALHPRMYCDIALRQCSHPVRGIHSEEGLPIHGKPPAGGP
jgi:hypothetical protein